MRAIPNTKELIFFLYCSSNLQIKLERSRTANRILSDQIGVTILSDDENSDADDYVMDYDEDDKTHFGTEQHDPEFAASYKYNTNVRKVFTTSVLIFCIKIICGNVK